MPDILSHLLYTRGLAELLKAVLVVVVVEE
jgi:hypothetical protein